MQAAINSKIYNVIYDGNRKCKFFITKFNDGTFHGEIWLPFSSKITYTEKQKSALSTMESIVFDSNSREEIFYSIKNWIEQNISTECEIELVEER